MNEKLGEYIALGLDTNRFWHLDISEYNINVRGIYTTALKNYVISMGFEKYDWLYGENPLEFEYKKGNCRILLSK
jgi:hypothetical protein